VSPEHRPRGGRTRQSPRVMPVSTPAGRAPQTRAEVLLVSRSVRHRLARRGRAPHVWVHIPVVSPYADRLMRAALGDHVCQPFLVRLTPEGR
jgi:hypothetical protein